MKWKSKAEFIELIPETSQDQKLLITLADTLPEQAEEKYDAGDMEATFSKQISRLRFYR